MVQHKPIFTNTYANKKTYILDQNASLLITLSDLERLGLGPKILGDPLHIHTCTVAHTHTDCQTHYV